MAHCSWRGHNTVAVPVLPVEVVPGRQSSDVAKRGRGAGDGAKDQQLLERPGFDVDFGIFTLGTANPPDFWEPTSGTGQTWGTDSDVNTSDTSTG